MRWSSNIDSPVTVTSYSVVLLEQKRVLNVTLFCAQISLKCLRKITWEELDCFEERTLAHRGVIDEKSAG